MVPELSVILQVYFPKEWCKAAVQEDFLSLSRTASLSIIRLTIILVSQWLYLELHRVGTSTTNKAKCTFFFFTEFECVVSGLLMGETISSVEDELMSVLRNVFETSHQI